MKIKLSELIGNDIKREFIAQFCKKADEYAEENCDIFDFCNFVRECIKNKQAEAFEIYFDTNADDDNCWIDIYGVFEFYFSIDKKQLQKYVYSGKINEIDFNEKCRYERGKSYELTLLLKDFISIFLSIYLMIGKKVEHLSDIFDYTEEPAQ